MTNNKMAMARKMTPRKAPQNLANIMNALGGAGRQNKIQSTYGSSDYGLQDNGRNYYDSNEFRNTLTAGPKGNWYDQGGNVFKDGTYDPTTNLQEPSSVDILDQGGVPVPNQAQPRRYQPMNKLMGTAGQLFKRNR